MLSRNIMLPILVILFALLAATAYAATDFSTEVSVPNTFLTGQTGLINVTITNNGPTDWFLVNAMGLEKWTYVDPWRVQIAGGASKIAHVYIAPPDDAEPGTTSFLLTVARDSTGARFERQLFVTIRQMVSATISTFSIDCAVCTDHAGLTAVIKNTGTEPVSGILAVDLGGIARNFSVDTIARDGKQTIEETFELGGLRPGKYNATGSFIDSRGHVTSRARTAFNVMLNENISYERQESGSVFGTTVTLTATNRGNTEAKAVLSEPATTSWWMLYTGPPVNMSAGQYYWSTMLAPGERRELTYSEVNWPLFAFIFIVIAGGIYAYVQSTSLTIRKRVLGRKLVSAGKDIAVSIEVRNARRAADMVVVRDVVPPIFSISGRFEIAKPVIRKISTGTEIIWKMGGLGAGEERVLHYKIKPSVDVYGGLTLHPATLRIKSGTSTMERVSNTVTLEGSAGGPKKLSVEVEK